MATRALDIHMWHKSVAHVRSHASAASTLLLETQLRMRCALGTEPNRPTVCLDRYEPRRLA